MFVVTNRSLNSRYLNFKVATVQNTYIEVKSTNGGGNILHKNLKLCFVLTTVVTLMISTSSVNNLASAQLSDQQRYQSGYDHGCSDAKLGGHPYLNSHPGHTGVFMEGYNKGYHDCSHSSKSIQGQAPTNPTKPNYPKQDFRTVCQYIQKYLVNSCSVYVNPDGSLTNKGTVAHNCIITGGFLTLLGSYGLSMSPSAIRNILEPLSIQTHCDGIVKWDKIESDVSGLLSAIATLRALHII